MQNVGAEMNLSETAFLLPQKDGWSLRWFTPKVEVALCGHATLASAHALWEERLLPASETARFHTKSGLLTAQQRDASRRFAVPVRDQDRIVIAGKRCNFAIKILKGEIDAQRLGVFLEQLSSERNVDRAMNVEH